MVSIEKYKFTHNPIRFPLASLLLPIIPCCYKVLGVPNFILNVIAQILVSNVTSNE